MPNEKWDDEWREVQDQRYNPGFYTGSGKINPFFTRLGKPSRRFGIQLLIVAVVFAVVPFLSFVKRAYTPFFIVVAIVLAIGGVSHMRMAARKTP